MIAALVVHALTDPHAGETFKPHPEFPHLHVSDHGRVWSEKSRKFVGHLRGDRGGQLRPGHAYLAVTTDNLGRKRDIHVLVLETFVGPRPANHDGDHIDHDHLNNALGNLRWRTVNENRADTTR